MQTVEIAITELTKEEVKELPQGTRVLIFNSLFENYAIKKVNKRFLKTLELYNEYIHFFIF